MKRKIQIVFLFVFIVFICKAQTPESLNYQAVVRSSSGTILTSQNVSVKFSILSGSVTGSVVYSETHSVQTSSVGLINLKIGDGDSPSSNFSEINWGTSTFYLKVELDEAAGTNYTTLGTSQILSVPYALFSKNAQTAQNAVNSQTSINSDSAGVAKILDEEVLYFTDNDTLFAVKDRLGNIVFAVFPDGAKVFVNQTIKGNVGGFAVSGRTPNKALEENFFIITADSSRIYILDEAIKGNVGGFAVSGRTPNKAGTSEYFNVSGRGSTALEVINPSEPRMVWYPKREAFLVGRVLIEHPDSVGLNSVSTGYESKAKGNYSQAFGYKSFARKDYSTAIGKNAIANGLNSFALGNLAIAKSDDSYAIGSGALALGEKSFAFGSVGVDTLGNLTDSPKAIGDFSFAMGLGAVSSGVASMSIGANSQATGNFSTSFGLFSESTGERSVAIGPYAKATGYGSAAIGYRNIASGPFALAGGVGSTAEGYSCISLGAYCHATGSRSVALGDGCTSDGFGSFAAGKSSDALAGGVAIGMYTTATGQSSYAFGRYANTNYKEGSFVFCDGINKSHVTPKLDGQVIFLGTGGMHFYTTKDTAEAKTFVIEGGTGNIGLGTFTPGYKLDIAGNLNVDGIIYSSDIQVIPDFVFEDSYDLESIEEHADIMWSEKHLPSLKSAKKLEEEGRINISERREQMLEELEKAHIYIEQLHKRIKNLEEQNTELSKNTELESRIEKLEEIIKQLTQGE